MKARAGKAKRFRCPNCSKRLSSNQNLKQHLSVHSGLKPLRCNFGDCTASFAFASQLSSHKARHLTEKPNRLDFRSLKGFVMLFLEVYSSISESKPMSSDSPYTLKDANLPDVSVQKQDKNVILPGLSTLKTLS